mmetsp:Transcript_6343/g.11375  ORF Transcript_6343/g.11375 Transcript_6343/m.11375 type:complete len:101 (+) Transcript_6343:480-782(+)
MLPCTYGRSITPAWCILGVTIGMPRWIPSFYLCLTMPCVSVSAISIAGRMKSLLVQCVLLESDELDGDNNNNANSKTGAQNVPTSTIFLAWQRQIEKVCN